jgi:hypothetical protein
MMRAFAMRIARALVSLVFAGGVADAAVPIGAVLAGCEENGIVEPWWLGCMPIGPVGCSLCLSITNNALFPVLFARDFEPI